MLSTEVRVQVATSLRWRRSQIVQEALSKVASISPPAPRALDPRYVSQLPKTVASVFDYFVTAVESGREQRIPVPALVLTQARLAALTGISFDTLIRRCASINSLIAAHATSDAARITNLPGSALSDLARLQAVIFDQVVAQVSQEYRCELAARVETGAARKCQLVEGLLAGELLDTEEISYEFDANHAGMVFAGPQPQAILRDMASRLEARLLVVHPGINTYWAWIGLRHPLRPDDLQRAIDDCWPADSALGVGEPMPGQAGWRTTHLQAKAAYAVAVRTGHPVGYLAVARDVCMMQDPLLTDALFRSYIRPIIDASAGKTVLIDTLRAYFAVGRSGSAAAALLRVSRQAVSHRLRTVEGIIGRPLSEFASDIETALRLEELEATGVASIAHPA